MDTELVVASSMEVKNTGNAGKGRPTGARNKATLAVEEKLKKFKYDPVEGMVLIAKNQLPCGECRGKRVASYLLPEGNHSAGCWIKMAPKSVDADPRCSCDGISERTCQSCKGTGLDNCSPALRGQMASDLCGYLHSKLKAIQLSGVEGAAPIQVEVKFVD